MDTTELGAVIIKKEFGAVFFFCFSSNLFLSFLVWDFRS